jgi:hypothetical protein
VAPNPLTGTHLSRLLAAARLAERYQQVFPQHPEWLQETFDWRHEDAEEAFAGMMEAFLGWVEAHRFPVMVDVWDVALEDALYYLDQIPIIPQGLEHWYKTSSTTIASRWPCCCTSSTATIMRMAEKLSSRHILTTTFLPALTWAPPPNNCTRPSYQSHYPA